MADVQERAIRADANAAFLPPVPAAVARAARASEALSARMVAGENMQAFEQAPDGREMPAMQEVWIAAPKAAPTPVIEHEPNPAPAVVVDPPASAAPAITAAEWEQKFKSLEGRFNAQVPQLVARARQAETQADIHQRRVMTLEAENAALKTQIATPATPTPPAGAANADVEQWGADFVEVARRQAREAVSGELDELKGQVKQLLARPVAAAPAPVDAQRQHQERTNAAIDHIMGDNTWQRTNLEPGFISWLQDNDDFSGQRRHTLLENAYRQGNAHSVAAFFKAYRNEHTAPAPRDASQTDTPAGAGFVNLADLAAPGGNPSGGAGGAGSEKPIISQKDIAQHYQRMTQGYYRNNPREQARMTAMVDSAVTEGRVR
jgi:hypothetical protein